MTEIVQTPAAPEVPRYPALGSANFNQESYAYGSAMPAVSYRFWEIGKAAETNAIAAGESAEFARSAMSAASASAQQAAASADDAAQSALAALTYAQAAGSSAGIPAPEAGRFLGTDGQGNPAWVDVPEDASKLAKSGGIATALGYSYKDHGTVAAAGAAAVNVNEASVHRIQAGGNLTLTIAGWASDGRSEDLELHCVNFGGKTVTWPAGNWIKSDGSYAAAVGNSGVTWQVAGTDRVLVMRDAGQLYFKVMR